MVISFMIEVHGWQTGCWHFLSMFEGIEFLDQMNSGFVDGKDASSLREAFSASLLEGLQSAIAF